MFFAFGFGIIVGTFFSGILSFVVIGWMFKSDIDCLVHACKQLRLAAFWFADNEPGTPVPDWVDDAVNRLGPEAVGRVD